MKARNVATNFEVTVHSKSSGSYSISNLPVGTYELKFTKEGFETETHTQVLVTSDRTTTVDGSLKVGAVSTTVEVTCHAAHEPDGRHEWLRGGPAHHSRYAAGDRQLHATGDSDPGRARGFSVLERAPTPDSAIRPSSPTATATPATAFR